MSTSRKSNPDDIIWNSDNNGKKSWWSKRSGLEKKLIMSLAAICIITVGILVYVGIKPTESINTETSCSSPDCLVPASELINRLDTAIDPCEDFFKFACGKRIKNTVKEDIEQELLKILKTPESNDDHYALKNEKRLFQSCINESELEDESLPIVQSMIRELNDWPVVVGHKWRERQFDWVETLIKLRKNGYHDSMIVRIQKFSDSTDGVLKLEIMPGSVTYVNKEHTEAYVRYMSSVAELFGSEPNRAAIEMEKVADFMEKLIEVSNIYRRGNQTKMTVRELQDEYDDVDWFKLINSFISPQKVAFSDYREFPNTDFMDAFTTLMSKTPKRIQANYIIWSVIERLVPFMPKSFRELEANYTCAINADTIEKDREKLCQSTVEDLFIPVPSWMLYARNHLTKEKQKEVEIEFDHIKMEVMVLLDKLSLISDIDRDRFVQKLNDTSAVIGTDWNYENDAVFEKYEPNSNRRAYRGSFLSMYLLRRKQKKNFLTHTTESRLDIIMNAYVTGTLAIYYLGNNKLELPVGMFRKQFYKSEGPAYLKYAAFGTAVAQELIRGLVFSTDRSDWSKDSLLNYNDYAKCFLKTANDALPISSPDDLFYVQDGILANIAGLKAAYDVYQKYIEINGEEAIPFGIDYTSNQLFWIAAVSYECYESDEDPLQSHLQNVYMNNIPFANSEDFANDFGCAEQSKMNKANKCKLELL